MAFKIAKKPTFTAKVDVYTPNNKGGHDYSTFEAEFSRCKMSELDDLRSKNQFDVMREKLVGWKDFNDEENNPVEFTPENLEILIDIPEALNGLREAFWGSVVKAKEKN